MKSAITLFILIAAAVAVHSQSEFHLEETYQISNRGTLFLDSEDAEITITGTDRSDVYVKIDRIVKVKGVSTRNYQRFDFEVVERNGDLILKEKSESRINFMIGSISEDYTIELLVPTDISLNLEGEDDDYYIDNLGGELVIASEDGDANVRNYHGASFEFNTEDGDLVLEGGSGSIHIESEDGNVVVNNGQFDEIDVETEDGDVEFTTTLSNNGYYLFKTEDGDMELNFTGGEGTIEIIHDDSDIRTTEGFELVRDSEEKTVVKWGSGNSKVKVITEDGSIRIGK